MKKAKPSIADTNTNVYLWCGSKEPYAKKSNNIVKKYLKSYSEEIWDGLGHGNVGVITNKAACERKYCRCGIIVSWLNSGEVWN